MTLYATGMRLSELARFKISHIDSQRMIIRVVEGKGSKDRDLPLRPALLETLREYWRWRKPRLYLFPTRTCRHQRRGQENLVVDRQSQLTPGSGKNSSWRQGDATGGPFARPQQVPKDRAGAFDEFTQLP